jgi:hypothetical protein
MFRPDFDFFNQCDFNGKCIDPIENFFYSNTNNNNGVYNNKNISNNFYDNATYNQNYNQPEMPKEADHMPVSFQTPIKKLMAKPANDLNNIITSDDLLYDLLNNTLVEEDTEMEDTPIKKLMAKPINEMDNIITDDRMLYDLLDRTLVDGEDVKTPIKKMKIEIKTPTPIKKLISKPFNDLDNIITSDELLYDLLSLIEEETPRKYKGCNLQHQYNLKFNEELVKIQTWKENNQLIEQQIEWELVPFDDNAIYL